jgi:lysylphosphatidylglycerol synthetase-like protein (DUF2156 family)
MNKIKATSSITLIKGISLILLGIAHTVAIFIMVDDMIREKMPDLLMAEFKLWFFVTGVFFIYAGVIDVISYPGLKKGMNWAWRTSFSSALFCCLTSPVGIIVLKGGPPLFILFIGLCEIIPLILYRKEFGLN